MKKAPPTSFEKAAAESGGGNVLTELFGFLKSNRKWWLLPLLVIFLVFGLLIFLSSTGVAPFIYSLF